MTKTIRSVEEIQNFLQNLRLLETVNELELKVCLKEIQLRQQENAESVSTLSEILINQIIPIEIQTDAQLLNLLNFLKILSEDKISTLLCPSSSLVNLSAKLFPLVTELISKATSSTGSSNSNVSSLRSASLLHKSVKISLNLVKAQGKNNEKPLEEFGLHFLALLEDHPNAILDIKCNGGLVVCHLSRIEFLDSCFQALAEGADRNKLELSFVTSEFESKVWKFLTADYVNRVAICFGAFGSRPSFSENFLKNVAGAVLLQTESNSTKEAVNLGLARVLEIWMDKAVNFHDPPALWTIFPLIEIFVFTYLAGHIDAVKNCCRNMLSNLSVIYSMLDGIEGFSSEPLLKDLLIKILAKPYHVKWISLAAVSRSNSESRILVDIWTNPAENLLCAERTFKNSASEVYLSLMKYTFTAGNVWREFWLTPLLQTQESQNNESNWPQKKVILTKALGGSDQEMQKSILNQVISAMSESNLSTESWLLIVECLKIGTELGIFMESHECKRENAVEKFRGVLPRDIFNSWTFHSNPQIRLASFSLLVETKKTSELFSTEDFYTLKSLLKYNLVSQNPAFRQQFFAYYKRLMRRLKDGKSFCARQRKSEDLSNYLNFIQWLWTFFTEEGLFPGANFSRRCQSLKCLVELLNVFPIDDFASVLKSEESLDYLRWLGDSYENNKIAAVEILSRLKIPKLQNSEFVQKTLNTALTLLTSVKPPESVTGRYLLLLLIKTGPLYPWNVLRTLLSKLEQILYVLQRQAKTLLEVSSQTPPYGLIRAIRLIFETYKSEMISEATTGKKCPTRPLKSGSYPLNFDILQEYTSRFLKVCLKLDELLFPVLGSAAPEGFLPDLNENSTPENSKIVRSLNAQMLLVSSWRSMKEICILLTELCVTFPLEGEIDDKDKKWIFNFEQVKSIGEHLLYLLLNLMHRGVFEQVFVGFKNFATRLKKSKAPKIRGLSQQWLQDVMSKVADKCTTRRSAGLPFVFQAILTPEVANEEVMDFWMKKLLEPEEDLNRIMAVRIHSMNVLRALFRDANFARAIMEWVPKGIKHAFTALRANEWAEQNSGLMLYGSVIRRTFGPKLNLMSAPTFFRRFPEMYDFLLAEIKSTASLFIAANRNWSNGAISQKENDLAYHLLLLFSCFSTAPGKLEEGDFRLAAFIPYIQACGASQDIQVRTIASKALVPFITSPGERQRVLKSILDSLILLSRKIRNNKLHGDMLQLIAILNLIKSHDERVSINLIEKFQLIIDLPKNTNCPLIFETFSNLSICLNIGPLQTIAKTLQKVTAEALLSSGLVPPAAGLPDALERISRSTVHFSSPTPLEITAANPILMEQFLQNLVENKEVLLPDFNSAIVSRLLEEKFSFDGQTDYEIAFLEYFTLEKFSFENIPDKNLLENLLNRMLDTCEADFGRMECKEKSLRVAGKVLRIGLSGQRLFHLRSRFSNVMLDWTNSTQDDDLRLAVAVSLPTFPLGSNYASQDFCKLWACALTLVQDDEDEIRHATLQKLSEFSQIPACSLKSLEFVLQTFLTELESCHSIQGLCTLLARILRDDYEVVATVADDEDEDRLFERSEMNMFAEKVTLTNTLAEFLLANPKILNYLRATLETSSFSVELLQLFQGFTCNNNLMNDSSFKECVLNVSATEGLKLILEKLSEDEKNLQNSDPLPYEGDNGEKLEHESLPETENLLDKSIEDDSMEKLLRGHEKGVVQNFIRNKILLLFC